MTTLEHLKENKIIAIIRGVSNDDLIPLVNALYNGGVRSIEMTFNQNGDLNLTSLGIKNICELGYTDLCVGAGSVLSPSQVDMAYKAGAKYIISPNTDSEVIAQTKKHGMVSMPGAMTPTEIIYAHNIGADIVKIFPAGILGPSYFKAIMAPINHIFLSAVGGINEHNINDFLKVGIRSFGISNAIVDKKAIASKHYDAITRNAKLLVSLVNSKEN